MGVGVTYQRVTSAGDQPLLIGVGEVGGGILPGSGFDKSGNLTCLSYLSCGVGCHVATQGQPICNI